MINFGAARKEHLRRSKAEPNWAVLLWRSNLVYLDIDQHKADADGVANLRQLLAEHGPLPETLRDSRGHYFFRAPAGSEAWHADHIAPGVELKCGASLVHVPPSRHASGADYTWLTPIETTPIAELPAWIVDWARLKFAPKPKVSAAPPQRPSLESREYDKLHRRIAAYVARVPGAVEGSGGRMATLKFLWNIIRGFDLPAAELMPHILDWNATCLPPWPEHQLRKMANETDAKPGARGWLVNRDREIPYDDFPMKLRPRNEPPKQTPQEIAEEINRAPMPSADAVARDVEELERERAVSKAMDRLIWDAQRKARPAATAKCQCHSFLYHPEKNQVRTARLACGCWDCLQCAAKLKKIWSEHIKLMIESIVIPPYSSEFSLEDEVLTGPRETPVYIGTVEAGQPWARTRRQFARLHAEFVRIESADRTTFAVCATLRFPGSVELDPPVASTKVAEMINAIPIFGDTRKPIHTSKNWQRPKRPPSGWRYIGALDKSYTRHAIVSAMEAECGDCRAKTMPFPFFIWAADSPVPIDAWQLQEDGWGTLIRELYMRIDLRLKGTPLPPDEPIGAAFAADSGKGSRDEIPP